MVEVQRFMAGNGKISFIAKYVILLALMWSEMLIVWCPPNKIVHFVQATIDGTSALCKFEDLDQDPIHTVAEPMGSLPIHTRLNHLHVHLQKHT